MAQISNVRNDGFGYVTTGPKQANSYNVSPVNLVATASPGTILHKKDLANFDFFNAVQTSASTDQIQLNTSISVGAEVWIYCVSACKVGTISGSGITINGGTDAQLVTLAVGSIYRFLKTSATTFICNAFDASAAMTAPTPA